MIIGFSTSCAWASVAAINEKNSEILWEGALEAPQGASGACLGLLQQMLTFGLLLEEASLFVADIGPGSFTGVRVGVTLAKSFGFLYGRQVAGANSFDLISANSTAVLPSKRGEFFVRIPGQEPFRTTDLPTGPYLGFGPGIDPPTYPDASRFQFIVAELMPVDAASFVPRYLIEPSISIPKKPFAGQVNLRA